MENIPIPSRFWKFFWDIDIAKLDHSRKASFIIQRLLDKGNHAAVKWLRKHYKENQIKETLMKNRGFSPRTAIFWSIFYNIPKSKIVCLQTPYLKTRKTHWPY